MATENNLPPLTHVLETCLYVRDIQASKKFYEDVLNIKPFMQSHRSACFSLGNTTLLLFQLGQTDADITTPSGVIPRHGPSAQIVAKLNAAKASDGDSENLKQHFCVAVQSTEDVAQWEAYLQKKGVPIISCMNWERGGKSVYFADLDGHLAEIASRGIWPHY
ncbi:VOC family protein [Aspergillus foveolatus]|uniref:VOC family protein n=1 Tax=Aspergillus foveolatus TaxID=210207 RepID=UPI003CCCFB3E